MKKNWAKVGLTLSLASVFLLSLVFSPIASACINGDGTTDGATNCILDSEEEGEHTTELQEYFTVEKLVDFGRATELDRSYTKEIEVLNNTVSDVIIDAEIVKNTDVNEENAKLSDWLVFVGGVSHFNIPSMDKKSVSIRAVIPADAAVGAQYANVVLRDSNGHSDVAVVKLEISGENAKYESEAMDAWIDPIHVGENIVGRVTIKNTGTSGFESRYELKAKSVFGSDWTTVKVDSGEVFPGKQIDFSTSEVIGFGIYSVEQRATFVNSEGRIVESLLTRTVINLPWWGLVAAGGVILLIIILVIVIKTKKKHSGSSDKLEKEERKARKAEIEKIEAAEEEAIEEENAAKDVENEDMAVNVAKATKIAPRQPIKRVATKPAVAGKAISIKVSDGKKPVARRQVKKIM